MVSLGRTNVPVKSDMFVAFQAMARPIWSCLLCRTGSLTMTPPAIDDWMAKLDCQAVLARRNRASLSPIDWEALKDRPLLASGWSWTPGWL